MAKIKSVYHEDTVICKCGATLSNHWWSGFICPETNCREFREVTTGNRDKRWEW